MPIQIIVQSNIKDVNIIETPIPEPKRDEVVIKVTVAGTNPKDWKYPLWKNWPHNSGDDLAGIVHSIGSDVYEFKPGDRVAALHKAGTENGSFAEYSVAPAWTTFHISHNVTFEEAATVPTAALTAAVALYSDLKVPALWEHRAADPEKKPEPILIYGITSAVGAFAAKFARLSGLHPVIGVAGRAQEFANSLADHVVDYRQPEDRVVAAVESYLQKEGITNGISMIFDAISENGSLETTARIIAPGGSVSTVLPPALFARDKDQFAYPQGVTAVNSAVPQVHSTHTDFGFLWSRFMSRLLSDGRLKPHPYEIIPGGLNGILVGLQKLKGGLASGVKYVYQIDDTSPVMSATTDDKGVSTQNTEDHEGGNSLRRLRDFPFPS